LVKLPESDAQAFRLYVQWLYTGRLHTRLSLARDEQFKDRRYELTNLIEGYLLGDYLQDNDYKDILVDAMVEWASEYSGVPHSAKPADFAARVYTSTDGSSPLRKLLADLTVWLPKQSDWKQIPEDQFPHGFLCDVIRVFSAKIQQSETAPEDKKAPFQRYRGTCHYHCHGKEACYKTKGSG
jgi:hypothetical protein